MIPKLIKGGNFIDERGSMSFVNDFDIGTAKRFYTITHISKEIVRAWQGHEFEQKYFFPLQGKFLIAWVQIDNFANPSENLSPNFAILDAKDTALLHIPNGYANGLKALTQEAQIGVFSDFDLEKSVLEKHRYDPDLWFDWTQDFGTFENNMIY
jgi:dTDP-4-dehydrorhamnose 3,5-epimerase-like enzyme